MDLSDSSLYAIGFHALNISDNVILILSVVLLATATLRSFSASVLVA